MSPIHRKIRRDAEPAQPEFFVAEPPDADPIEAELTHADPIEEELIHAESRDAEPGMTADEIGIIFIFVIVLLLSGLALLSWLRLPWQFPALAAIIIVLFLAIYRLSRPGTEQEPNLQFNRRDKWLVRGRHSRTD